MARTEAQMKERPPERPEFESILESIVKKIRSERGPCPEAFALAQWKLDQLPKSEAASISKHVEICGQCQLASEDGAETVSPEKADKETKRRLDLIVDQILKP